MLEIFIIISVSKKISAMMKEKGRSAAGYVTIFVFLWIFGELTGAIVGVVLADAQGENFGGGRNDFDWQPIVGALIGAAIGGGTGFLIANAVPPAEIDDDRQRYLDTLDDRRDRDRDNDDDRGHDDRPRSRRRAEDDDGKFEGSDR